MAETFYRATVTVKLKKEQHIHSNSWKVHIREELRLVNSDVFSIVCISYKDAVDCFKTEEIESIEIKQKFK
jgi:hypothetical protein